LLFFGTHLRRSLTSRRTMLSLALALLPGAIAWTLAHFAHRVSAGDIATHLGWLLILQVLLPILALIGGTAVVTEEVEDRTITFLFSRPIVRASLLLGRWLAALVLLSAVLALGAGLM
jgi:ABC-type transport system involved in multi-copper enzyme maturation permease subunit